MKSSVSETKSLLEKLEIRPRRSLGQNFLVNENLSFQIVHFVTKRGKIFVEVGPGLGALTKHLPYKKNSILIEKDKKIANLWSGRGYKIFCKDALNFDWNLIKDKKDAVIFGNLPYNIASPLIIELTLLKSPFEEMVFMFQKEVALRIKSRHRLKTYSLLTVFLQSFWDIQKLFEVSPIDFFPRPQVASHVLSFVRKKDIYLPPQKYLKFLKQCFKNRRKFLINNLQERYDRKECEAILRNLKLDPKVRAEVLQINQFEELFKFLEG